MKAGANFQDRNRIKEMHAEGYEAGEISDALFIHKDVIKAHLPEPEPEPEPKAKAATKSAKA